MTSFSLRQVKLRPGEQYRDALRWSCRRSTTADSVTCPCPARCRRSSRSRAGEHRDGLHPRLHRAALRAVLPLPGRRGAELPIRAREYQDESSEDEEMRTEYVDGNMLDVSSWARDAIALALPEKILCMPDCAGLCGVCGKNLNDEPHTHEDDSDPRWAALEALRDQT